MLGRKKLFSDTNIRRKYLFDPELGRKITPDEHKQRIRQINLSNLNQNVDTLSKNNLNFDLVNK